MRIAIDPIPLVLGIYAQVGGLMERAVERAEGGGARELGRRFAKGGAASADGDVKQLVKAVHADVKTSDKLLKKTSDVWKLAGDGDRVALVVHRRGEDTDPRSYVLLRPDDVREILRSIREAAEGAGHTGAMLDELERAIAAVQGRPSDYYTFGFDPLES